MNKGAAGSLLIAYGIISGLIMEVVESNANPTYNDIAIMSNMSGWYWLSVLCVIVGALLLYLYSNE